jgi:hypothetical protein
MCRKTLHLDQAQPWNGKKAKNLIRHGQQWYLQSLFRRSWTTEANLPTNQTP